MGQLSGKVAIVTGASRGIGREIALELARNGADLLVTARDADMLEATARDIKGIGTAAAVIAVDLREHDSAARVVKTALQNFGRLDILVNNAGATKRGSFLALTEEDWSDGFALKFFGTVRLSRAAWTHLRQNKGSIVNIAGIGGRTPGSDFAIGGSVNAALLSFTKALADSGLEEGIQINAVNPGSVQTSRLTERIRVFAEQHGISDGDAAERMKRESKISRFGEPKDIAHLVTFLVSERGRWMHGSLIDMDGGQTKTI